MSITGCTTRTRDIRLLSYQNLIYNVPGGKLNRGISVVDSVTILLNRPPTDDEYFKAALLGWCIELVRSPFFISNYS